MSDQNTQQVEEKKGNEVIENTSDDAHVIHYEDGKVEQKEYGGGVNHDSQC
jgi:hypothetical protein